MGSCCCKNKKSESTMIFEHFLKIKNEEVFDYKILNYDFNYNKIIKKSMNNFKKLEKKQKVRFDFIGQVNKYIKNSGIKKSNEGKNVNSSNSPMNLSNILFFELVFTILLSNMVKMFKEENENSCEIDILRNMHNFVVENLNNQIYENGIYIKSSKHKKKKQNSIIVKDEKNFNFDNEKMKIFLFYTAKMLVILYDNYIDAGRAINVNTYVKVIEKLVETKYLLNESELTQFLYINLVFISKYVRQVDMNDIKNASNLTLDNLELLMKYIIMIYKANFDFILENGEEIKNIYYGQTQYRESMSIKIQPNMPSNSKKSTNPSHSIILDNTTKGLINNINDVHIGINNKKLYFFFFELNENLYYLLDSCVQDIEIGKKIFIKLDSISQNLVFGFDDINKALMISEEKIINFYSLIQEIFSLYIFKKCKEYINKKIALSYLSFIGERILKDINSIRYDEILMGFWKILGPNNFIIDNYIRIVAKVFIKELPENFHETIIENLINFKGTSQIFSNSYMTETNDNILFLYRFLYILSKIIQEDNIISNIKNVKLLHKIYKKLNEILAEKNKKILKLSVKITKNELIYMLKNYEFSINDNLYNIEKNYVYDDYKKDTLNSYINFSINLLNFINNYFILTDDNNNENYIVDKKDMNDNLVCIINGNILDFIFELIIYNNNNPNCFNNEIIELIKIIFIFLEKNSKNLFKECNHLYRNLGKNINKIRNIMSNISENINLNIIRIIYVITTFIISQIKYILKIPCNLEEIHDNCYSNVEKLINSAIPNPLSLDIITYISLKYSNKKAYKLIKDDINAISKKTCNSNMICDMLDEILNNYFGLSSQISAFFNSQENKLLKKIRYFEEFNEYNSDSNNNMYRNNNYSDIIDYKNMNSFKIISKDKNNSKSNNINSNVKYFVNNVNKDNTVNNSHKSNRMNNNNIKDNNSNKIYNIYTNNISNINININKIINNNANNNVDNIDSTYSHNISSNTDRITEGNARYLNNINDINIFLSESNRYYDNNSVDSNIYKGKILKNNISYDSNIIIKEKEDDIEDIIDKI